MHLKIKYNIISEKLSHQIKYTETQKSKFSSFSNFLKSKKKDIIIQIKHLGSLLD